MTLRLRVSAVQTVSSEGHHAFHHEAVDLATVPDVRRRESEELLLHVLALHEQGRRHEPAGAERAAIDADVLATVVDRRGIEETTLRRIGAGAREDALVPEAVDQLAALLLPGAPCRLAEALALVVIDDAEELEAAILDEGVDRDRADAVRETDRPHVARPRLRGDRRGGVLHHQVVATAG